MKCCLTRASSIALAILLACSAIGMAKGTEPETSAAAKTTAGEPTRTAVKKDSSTDSTSAQPSFINRVWEKIKKIPKIGVSKIPFEKRIKEAEKIGRRLKEEYWKLQVVLGEMEKLKNALNDLRDFQLYPGKLTKTEKKWAARFDKKLEKTEKKIDKLIGEYDGLKRPLLDAIAILKEMTIGELNIDMLIILEKENIDRIKAILQMKREINEHWKTVNALFEEFAEKAGIIYEKPKTMAGFDAEFFAILYSNLGKSSDLFFEKAKTYKDSLTHRGKAAEWKQMARVDIARIQERIKSGKYKTAKRDLASLSERFEGKFEIGNMHYLHAKTLLALGLFREAKEVFAKIGDNSAFRPKAKLGIIQAFFLMDSYGALVGKFMDLLDSSLTTNEYNFALLLACQAAFRTNMDDSVLAYAAKAKTEGRFYAEMLFTLAQVYLRKNDARTANSLLKKVIGSPGKTRGTENIVEKAKITQAYILYEQGKYNMAVKKFFGVLKSPDFFVEALHGIVWSYLKSGHNKEAEITLKKLINQNPDSYLAVEGILMLSRKLMARANLEWQYAVFCDEEKASIENLAKSLEKKRSYGILEEKELQEIETRIDSLFKVHSKRKPLQRDEIAKLYQVSEDICSIILRNYRTGAYLETGNVGRREKLITDLSELHDKVTAQEESMLPDEIKLFEQKKKASVGRVKDAVQKARVFMVSLLMDRRNWENDYAAKYLTQMSDRLVSLRNEAGKERDSATAARLEEKATRLAGSRNSYSEITQQERAARRNLLIQVIEQSRKEPLSGKQEQFLQYQLGELLYEKEKDNYLKNVDQYDRQVVRFDSLMALFQQKKSDVQPSPPKAPRLDYAKAEALFKDLVTRYPDGTYSDAALYSLGFCYFDLGKDTLAHKQFETLVAGFPSSSYAPQSHMIIGEFWFDNAELEKAVAAYTKVLGFTESEWFDEALYKLGWSYYRLSNAKKAISSFMYLMSDNELSFAKGKKKSMLENESVDYIAISFAEDDIGWQGGIDKARTFIDKIQDDKKGMRIMHKLADVYKAQGTDERLKLARKAYETLLETFPDYDKNPEVELSLISVHEKQGRGTKTNQYRMEIFKKYNRYSDWAKAKRGTKAYSQGDSIAKLSLYEAANSYILEAAQRSDVGLYQKAMNAYKYFISTYRDDSKTSECHYNIAEVFFSLGNYTKAADEYMKVSRLYKKSQHQETAAWNAIVSAQNNKKLAQHNGPSAR